MCPIFFSVGALVKGPSLHKQSMPGFVLIEDLFFSKVGVIIGSPSSNNKSVEHANIISLR